jgi:hypothetical protein
MGILVGLGPRRRGAAGGDEFEASPQPTVARVERYGRAARGTSAVWNPLPRLAPAGRSS